MLGSRDALWRGLVDYVTSVGIQLFYHVVCFSVYEGWYILRQWRQTYQEKEELTKAQWQIRFNSPKSQVNPHRTGDPVPVQFAQLAVGTDRIGSRAGGSVCG